MQEFLSDPAATHNREELLCATENKPDKVVASVRKENNPVRGKDEIGVRVGKVINKFKVAKHFDYRIEHDSFTYRRNQKSIDKEAALDGIYVIRTNVETARMDSHQVVGAYKGLAKVESAFRSFKSASLKVSPIYHYRDNRVRTHVFLACLSTMWSGICANVWPRSCLRSTTPKKPSGCASRSSLPRRFGLPCRNRR